MPAHGKPKLFAPKHTHGMHSPFGTEWDSVPGSNPLQTQSPTPLGEKRSASASTQSVGAQQTRMAASANSSAPAIEGAVEANTQPPSAPPSLNQLREVSSPLRLLPFKDELSDHPDAAWVKRLLHGIEHGVHLGYHGPRCHRIAKNLASAFQHPQIIDKEIQKEVDLGRILGPYTSPPMPSLQCSGVGVVAKKSGGWRMIMHLSAPPDRSINDGIDKQEFTLRYSTIDDAVKLIQKHGQGAKLAKIDVKSAFRTIPVRHKDRELLGIYWKNKFYVDRCLPFGLRSAPFIFNQYADALEWILRNNYAITDIIHYLDDFLLVSSPSTRQCEQALQLMLEVLTRLGFPIAIEKLEGPAVTLSFLGILIDTIRMELRLPPDKLEALTQLLEQWHNIKRKITKRELLSLIGKLSFAAKVIPAGRIFLRRLIDLSMSVTKLHHHITLNAHAKEDIKWWLDFLPGWNGVSLMLQSHWDTSPDLQLYTDASGTLGFGAYFQGAWLMGSWSDTQLSRSIQWKELFAIVAATAAWGSKWKRKRILIHCDNQAIVHIWQT